MTLKVGISFRIISSLSTSIQNVKDWLDENCYGNYDILRDAGLVRLELVFHDQLDENLFLITFRDRIHLTRVDHSLPYQDLVIIDNTLGFR